MCNDSGRIHSLRRLLLKIVEAIHGYRVPTFQVQINKRNKSSTINKHRWSGRMEVVTIQISDGNRRLSSVYNIRLLFLSCSNRRRDS